MNNNFAKFSLLIFFVFCLSGCGFKPMYKLSESNIDFRTYSISFTNYENISRETKEEIQKSFPSGSENNNYIIEIEIIENQDPLITNTDGTVSKYRIEIIMSFKVREKNNSVYLMEDTVRGFTQYTVETSEIESDDKKKRMIRTATNSAIQMMISKIQSDASITNDN